MNATSCQIAKEDLVYVTLRDHRRHENFQFILMVDVRTREAEFLLKSGEDGLYF